MSIWLYPVFFLIAVIYSMVGFGGGSSYLGILALTDMPSNEIRAWALLCNITVVTGSTIWFWKADQLKWNKIVPIVTCSIPASFVGGYVRLDEDVYLKLLGSILVLAAIFMVAQTLIKETLEVENRANLWLAMLMGAIIGFVSGMVSIGGGIFLAPVLFLMRWGEAKTIAATCSFYILVNSIAGLLARGFSEGIPAMNINALSLVVAVLIGGQIGIRISSSFLNGNHIRWGTAVLIASIGGKLLLE